MEDLENPTGSPVLDNGDEPQANADPADPLNPEIEEEDAAPTPPVNDPTADNDALDDAPAGTTAAADDSDAESELEELDEQEFADFDPSALKIPTQPVAVDADNVGLIGVHKRKRTEEEERERKKKKKEGRREKAPKRTKKVRAGPDEDDFEGGPEMDGKRARKSKVGADGRKVGGARRVRTPENEEELSPEERRRRELDRKMDEALKTHRPVRRRAGEDLTRVAEDEIEMMRQKMAQACEADANARARGEPAVHKLAIIDKVTELLNRNTITDLLVDPETNILEAVRFMLEPADHDAALPNYKIQRQLFASLSNMNIGKEALVASGIGKVVLFYTKSIQPQPDIRRQAEKLIGDWMRVVLKKPKTTRHNPIATRTFDPTHIQRRTGMSDAERAAAHMEKRRKILAQPVPGNRARLPEGAGVGTYTVAPVNNMNYADEGRGGQGGGDAAFRRLQARSKARVEKR